MRRICNWFCVGIAGLALATGCNRSGSGTQKEPELPAWLTTDEPASTTPPADLFASEAPASLKLTLQPGEQFPLRKVVEQELIQDTVNGTPQVSRSRLDLMFAITVLEQRTDLTKLGVRYSRVRYQHDIAGEHVEYDSTNPPEQLPLSVLAYHDMVNDGFEFSIGADNQIVDVQGLTEFINRCLARVPPEQRQEVALGIEAGSGETGIANFVDNTIGLLPVGDRTRPGDFWDRQQSISRPVPMHVNNRYTLKELNDSLAVIDIRGSITPSTTVNMLDSGNGVRVLVKGGDTVGSCTIYRDTGLPKESRVDRTMNMTVVLSDSISFQQQKRMVTTIESFPSSNRAAARTNAGTVVPASGTRSSQRVTPADYSTEVPWELRSAAH